MNFSWRKLRKDIDKSLSCKQSSDLECRMEIYEIIARAKRASLRREPQSRQRQRHMRRLWSQLHPVKGV